MLVTGCQLTQSLSSLQGGYREYPRLQRRRLRFREADWRVQITLRVGGGVKMQIPGPGQNPQPSPACPHAVHPLLAPREGVPVAQVTVTS